MKGACKGAYRDFELGWGILERIRSTGIQVRNKRAGEKEIPRRNCSKNRTTNVILGYGVGHAVSDAFHVDCAIKNATRDLAAM
jgi:hypothetical protein